MKSAAATMIALGIALSIGAQPVQPPAGPREKGPALLREVAIRDGVLHFRVDSNGCTDKDSFRIDVAREGGPSGAPVAWRLSIIRTRPDECKAFIPEGVQLDFDLPADLGIRDWHAVVVANQVLAGGQSFRPDLFQACGRAFDMEVRAYQERVAAAESGTGPKENIATFREKLGQARQSRESFLRTRPAQYPSPVPEKPGDPSVFDEQTPFGLVLPPMTRRVESVVDRPLVEGSLVPVTGATRSGPFYHLAGIVGGDYALLREGRTYVLDLCLVYRREYIGFVQDYYVYVSGIRDAGPDAK
ncbi:MAG TPA: hypothetical protein VMQ10_07075 [Spirochaetia bacterium]|nr:hypothetical protein [Spirochaetia bacterium]